MIRAVDKVDGRVRVEVRVDPGPVAVQRGQVRRHTRRALVKAHDRSRVHNHLGPRRARAPGVIRDFDARLEDLDAALGAEPALPSDIRCRPVPWPVLCAVAQREKGALAVVVVQRLVHRVLRPVRDGRPALPAIIARQRACRRKKASCVSTERRTRLATRPKPQRRRSQACTHTSSFASCPAAGKACRPRPGSAS